MKDRDANDMSKEERTERSKQTPATALLVINKKRLDNATHRNSFARERDAAHRSAVLRTGDRGIAHGMQHLVTGFLGCACVGIAVPDERERRRGPQLVLGGSLLIGGRMRRNSPRPFGSNFVTRQTGAFIFPSASYPQVKYYL